MNRIDKKRTVLVLLFIGLVSFSVRAQDPMDALKEIDFSKTSLKQGRKLFHAAT